MSVDTLPLFNPQPSCSSKPLFSPAYLKELPLEILEKIVGQILLQGPKQRMASIQHYWTCKGLAKLLVKENEKLTSQDCFDLFFRKSRVEKYIPHPLPDELFKDKAKFLPRTYHLIEAYLGPKTPLFFAGVTKEDLQFSSDTPLNKVFALLKEGLTDPKDFNWLFVKKLKGLIIEQLKHYPIHLAAFQGDLEVFKPDPKGNMPPSISNEILSLLNGITPLHLACWNGQLALVRLLIENHPTLLGTQSHAGRTCLHYAAWGGNVAIIKELLQKAPSLRNTPDKKSGIPLHYAAASGHVEAMRELLSEDPSLPNVKEKEKDWNIKDKEGWTTLHLAVWGGHAEIVKEILQKDSSFVQANKGLIPIVYAKNNKGLTPIHLATAIGHVGIMQMLLHVSRSLADVQDNRNRTSFHFAAAKGDVAAMRVLLQTMTNSSSLKAQDVGGKTSFHFAAAKGHAETIRVLLQANPSLAHDSDNNGETPFQIALSKKHYDVAKVIFHHSSILRKIMLISHSIFARDCYWMNPWR